MAHSYRQTPIAGNTTARSEKRDKRRWSKQTRLAVRLCVRQGRDCDDLPVLEVWAGAKDGKRPFDPTQYPRLMRK